MNTNQFTEFMTVLKEINSKLDVISKAVAPNIKVSSSQAFPESAKVFPVNLQEIDANFALENKEIVQLLSTVVNNYSHLSSHENAKVAIVGNNVMINDEYGKLHQINTKLTPQSSFVRAVS